MKRIVKGSLLALGLVVGGATVGLASEPCVHEDGSGQVSCYWDAQTQGNGQGTDVYHVQGTPVYGMEARAWSWFDSSNAWSLLPYAHTRVEYVGYSYVPYALDAYSIQVTDGAGTYYLFRLTY